MFSFFSKQTPALGLDISDSSIRLMQLQPAGRGFFPAAFIETPLSKGLVVEDEIKSPEPVAAAIAESRARATYGAFTNAFVVLSVPEAKSFVRVISVAKMTEAEAEQAIPFEAEQYIPLAADQVYLDFKIIETTERIPSDKMKVVICATPKSVVESYLQVAQSAGLKPIAIEVESEAVARCLVDRKKKDESTLIVNISSVRTHLIIYDQGALQFTSDLPMAGSAFTQAIAQHLTVTLEEAEKLKLQMGLLSIRGGGKVRAAVQPLLSVLTEAIHNTINFYREHSEGGRQIKKIFLCGGGAKMRGLTDYLNQSFAAAGYPLHFFQIGDPWINVLAQPADRLPPISKADSVSYTTAIGLALRGLQNE